MEKIIGKLICIFLLCGMSGLFAKSESVVLEVQDINHEPIKQVEQAVPFILQMAISNFDFEKEPDYILGFENFEVSRGGTSQRTSIINGVKKVQSIYNFVLKSNKKGSYSIGPVSLRNSQNQTIQSNKVHIVVGDEVVAHKKLAHNDFLFQMLVDKKRVYLGEKIVLKIQFLYRKSFDNLKIFEPTADDFKMIASQSNSKHSEVTIDDVDYELQEWFIDLYPEKIGTSLIDGAVVSFIPNDLGQRNNLNSIFNFFGSAPFEKQLKARPVGVHVSPLPETENKTTAIGKFTKMHLSSQQKSVPAGEGMVVKAHLFGKGNLEIVKSLDLKMPDGLRCYDSNASISSQQEDAIFEFIVQGDQAGVYTIPSQIFHYFDSEDGVYKQVTSNELVVEITPGQYKNEVKQSSVNLSFQDDEDDKIDQSLEVAEEMNYKIIENGSIHYSKERLISHSFFLQILWAIFGFWLLLAIYRCGLESYLFKTTFWQRQQNFIRFKRRILKAKSQNNLSVLHVIFVDFFNALKINEAGFLRDYMIAQYLKEKQFSQEDIVAWELFFNKILEASFSQKNNKNNKDELFQEALHWVDRLKEKI